MASMVERVKEKVDLVALVSERVKLEHTGRHWKARCPFHDERTASFYVFPESGRWRCFGCNQGGSAFDFVMLTQNVDFRAALKLLAERVGIELEPEDPTQLRLTNLLNAAVEHYQERLADTPSVVEYLKGRLPDGAIERFRLGVASFDGMSALWALRKRKFTAEEIVAAGLASEKNGKLVPFFRNRIMIPITADRRVVGFGARAIGENKVKFINSPQSQLFDKRRLLFALDHCPRDAKVALVEGYFDAMAVHAIGGSAAAVMGTALTPEQARLLRGDVVLLFDSDTSGEAAVDRAILVMSQIAEVNRTVKLFVARLPEHKDADDVIREDPLSWQPLIDSACPVLDYVLNDLRRKRAEKGTLSAEEKEGLVRPLLPLLRGMSDLVRAEAILSIAAALQAPSDAFARWVAGELRGVKLASMPTTQRSRSDVQRVLLGALVGNPDLVVDVNRRLRLQEADGLSGMDFPDDEGRVLFTILQTAMYQIDRDERELIEELAMVACPTFYQGLERPSLTPDQATEIAVKLRIRRLREENLLMAAMEEEGLAGRISQNLQTMMSLEREGTQCLH